MMNMNNASQTSPGSARAKTLPPVPSASAASVAVSNAAGPDPQTLGSSRSEENILTVKSLKRKNFKNLSLHDTSPVDSAEDASLRLDSKSLRQKRNTLRPAPLLNLNDNSNFVVKSKYVDADSTASTNIIIKQISGLEVSDAQPSTGGRSAPAKAGSRKRQTVISSISPTRSTSSSISSPNEVLDDTVSPVFATTSAMKLNSKDLVTLKSLGSGNSGTVSKILHIPTQKVMAKKTIPIDAKVVIQNQIIRELKILHECHSPFIIEFYGTFLNNNTIVICMEYCNCGSLDKILGLCQPRQFPLFVLKKVTYSVMSGLVYLYSAHKIIHRDIKPSNVLMTHKGEFKLCDFGVSRELTNSLAMADTFVGTSTYMSPERIQGLNYGIKSDVWSTGLVIVELATGKSLWSDDDDDDDDNNSNNNDKRGPKGPEGILDLLQRIVNEKPPTLTDKIDPTTNTHYDKDLCTFIDNCLVKDDNARKSPFELLESEFLQGADTEKVNKQVKAWAKNIRKLHKAKLGK